MQKQYMRRFGFLLVCWLTVVSFSARADTYSLNDGSKVTGDPISINDNGVVFSADGSDLPRVPWDNLTQDSIRALLPKVKSPLERSLIEQLIEEPRQAKVERKEIVVKPIVPPARPTTGLGLTAIFSSPVGVVVLLILYAANIFAGYEVAIYRRQSIATVCGLAAIPFLGVLSPIIFISIPTVMVQAEKDMQSAQTRFATTAPPAEAPTAPPPEAVAPVAVAVAAVAAAPSAPAALPEPIVFKRGEFSFNRRFFETRLAGFFRLVPGEAEKDLVVYIQSGRGNFTGRRITRATPAELYLQTFHGDATADEMIPFVEILEVQIRHKDLA
jgi:hypothetical protein